jgi:hypothetical protein
MRRPQGFSHGDSKILLESSIETHRACVLNVTGKGTVQLRSPSRRKGSWYSGIGSSDKRICVDVAI